MIYFIKFNNIDLTHGNYLWNRYQINEYYYYIIRSETSIFCINYNFKVGDIIQQNLQNELQALS